MEISSQATEELQSPQEEVVSKGKACLSRRAKIIIGCVAPTAIVLIGLVVTGLIDLGINLFPEPESNPTALTRRLRQTSISNLDEILTEVNFDPDVDPYPIGPYNVDIPEENCFVIFEDESKTSYRLVTAVTNPEPNNTLSFLTHITPCGVCSNLQDLATYLETPNLADPVRNCGLRSDEFDCVSEIGFSDACAAIWTFNLLHTRDECTAPCFTNLIAGTPNNEPEAGDNFCEPGDADFNCQNTINNEPACDDFQFTRGQEFRLNECIQCDECKGGPMFQKVAGRTRRASGIESNINRPDVAADVDHNYF